MNAPTALITQTVVVGPFQCNCRILVCPRTGEAALIDPGDEASKLLARIDALKLPSGVPVQFKYLLHTHGHLDHIAATREVAESLIAQGRPRPVIALHAEDEPLYRELPTQAKMFGLEYGETLPIDRRLQHEELIALGDLKLSVIHTPGHSPGSVCLRLHEDSGVGTAERLYSGDTLFKGSVGRTDLWGGDGEKMFRNIRERILTLDGDTLVCPGHGPDTSIGVEKRENPFLI